MKRHISLVFAAIWITWVLIGGFPSEAFSQSGEAEITGTVSDVTGAPIPAASVIVANVETGARTTLTTTEVGLYYARLDPGTYRVEVSHNGFESFVVTNLALEAGRSVRQDVTLKVGAVVQSVEVSASAATAALDRDTSTVSVGIPQQTIATLPVATRRVFEELNVAPGVVWTSSGAWTRGWNISLYQPFLSIGGSPSGRGQIWIVDGINTMNSRLNGDGGGLPIYNPPPEDTAELHVLVNNYSAEFGGGWAGSTVTATKGGTNSIHGQVFDYEQNNAFAARNTFSASTGPNHYHNFGGAVGGPVKKDKIFYYADLEWTPQTQVLPGVVTVPTAQQAQGDFSHTFASDGSLIPIYDPATTCGMNGNPACAVDASGSPILTRQKFSGNVIPTDRFDTVSVNVLAHYPAPNAAGTITGANNFIAPYPATNQHANMQSFRGDYQLNDKNHLMGHFSRDYLIGGSKGPFAADPNSRIADPLERYNPITGTAFTAGFTSILRPTLMNDFRFIYSNFHNINLSLGDYPNVWDQDWAGKLGLKNVSKETFPGFNVAGYSSLGAMGFAQAYFANIWGNWAVQDTVNLIRGKHNIRIGGEIRPSRLLATISTSPSGLMNFDTRATAQPLVPLTGNAVASMLLGQVASSSWFDQTPSDERSRYEAIFVQDDWRVRPSLTLNLGVRYDYDTKRTDYTEGGSGFDPNVINPVCGCPGGMTFFRNDLATNVGIEDAFAPTQHNHVMPRLGFAWNPGWQGKKWVVRGGWGIFMPGQDVAMDQWQMPEVGNSTVIQQLTTDANGLVPAWVLDTGFPNYTAPPLNTAFGAVPIGQSPVFNPTFVFQNGLKYGLAVGGNRTIYSHMMNLSVQRELGQNMKLEVAFMGNLTENLPPSGFINVNIVPSNNLGPGNPQIKVPFPQYGTVTGLDYTMGISNYYAGYVQLTRRFANGLTFVTSYTHSRQLATSFRSPETTQAGRDYGPSAYDVPDRYVGTFTYELPLGPGKRFAGRGIVGKMVGGWVLTGMETAQSGLPFSVSPNVNTANNLGPQFLDVTGPNHYTSNWNVNLPWMSSSNFAFAAPYTLGDLANNTLRGPHFIDFDTSLTKRFAIRERLGVELRGDFCNLPNHPNYGTPDGTFGSRDLA